MRTVLRRKMAAWILARQGADQLPVRLSRRRLYVLPTRAGVGFGLLLVSMLIAALNYGNSLALLMTCLLGGLALVAMHQCHRNLLDIAVTEAWASPVFAGENGRVALTLANSSPLPRYRVQIDTSAGGEAAIDLPRQGTQRVELELPAQRRGTLKIARIGISTTHPFGLFRAWTWMHVPLELTVFPRPWGKRPLPVHGGEAPGQSPLAAADREEWRSLRDFREGDSPRQVAWKAYARGAPLLVKEYETGRAAQRLFDFDALADLDTERRLEQLARWIVDAEARGERYGLILRHVRLSPERGGQHCARALTALARYGGAPS